MVYSPLGNLINMGYLVIFYVVEKVLRMGIYSFLGLIIYCSE